MSKNAKVGDYFGRYKSPLSYKDDPRLVLPKSDIGVECEFEGVKNKKAQLDAEFSTFWEEHKEPSLHDNGREFAFKTPMFGEDALKELDHILKFAKDNGWKCTLRTGLHVHQDVRDMTYHQLIGNCVFYAVLEPAMYTFAGHGRDANNFCAPWYKCEGSIYDVGHLLSLMANGPSSEEEESSGLLQAAESFHKYAGLNLRPLRTYGSIEYRHLQMTLDFNRVVDWLNLILSLKKAAFDTPESSMAIIADAARIHPRKLMDRVFGERLSSQIYTLNPDVVEEIRRLGIPNAVELVSATSSAETFTDNQHVFGGKDFGGISKWLSAKKERPAQAPAKPKKGKVSLAAGEMLVIDEIANNFQNANSWVNEYIDVPEFPSLDNE